jgi:hypothetical protein
MPGDVLWHADFRPRDGDLAVVAMRYRRSIAGAIGAAAEYEMTRRAVKQFRVIDGVEMLCSADGAVRAASHEILGTVVAHYRPGWWRRPAMRRMRFAVKDGRSNDAQ